MIRVVEDSQTNKNKNIRFILRERVLLSSNYLNSGGYHHQQRIGQRRGKTLPGNEIRHGLVIDDGRNNTLRGCLSISESE